MVLGTAEVGERVLRYRGLSKDQEESGRLGRWRCELQGWRPCSLAFPRELAGPLRQLREPGPQNRRISSLIKNWYKPVWKNK